MIQTFTAPISGPNLVVMVGVHGDEPCGLDALAEIVPNLKIERGTVTFVLGNPKAVSRHKRMYEANLNRMFRPDELLSNDERGTYEYIRSRELMPILKRTDALLDIHSSTTKDSVPFVICEPQSFQCATALPAAVVVSGIDELHPTGTDAFVNQSGGMGICIECGNHADAKAKNVAIEAIKNFLAYFEVIQGPSVLPVPQKYIKACFIYKNRGSFTLSKVFTEFEEVSKGQIIGYDNGNAVVAPYDACILFPQNSDTPNSEVFILGLDNTQKIKSKAKL